ncbi:hypothetical protein [Granulicella sp. dw_53]|uniref:hypothetical protein n=1 Tax=Granulicella sp. dw_53 TaxID=2719792 RepID=UPI001BD3CD8F|nr:hypothetical protein [Granulicella sp. dw_53]
MAPTEREARSAAALSSLRHERRRQVRGLLFLAAAVLLFALLRAGLPSVFTPGWWRLW